MADFKRSFVRGLVVLLPTVLTLWLVVKGYQFVDRTIAEPINRSVRLGLSRAAGHLEFLGSHFSPDEAALSAEVARLAQSGLDIPPDSVLATRMTAGTIQTWWDSHAYLDFIGLVLAIILVYFAGRLLGGIFGRFIYRKVESVLVAIPVLKQIYPYMKQVVNFLIGDEQKMKFNRVVAVQYPRKGIWSIGFLTGNSLQSLKKKQKRGVTVFIPSSPAPFTGYTITVPNADIIDLPLTIEEAMRFSVSAGVLVPDHQQLDPATAVDVDPEKSDRTDTGQTE